MPSPHRTPDSRRTPRTTRAAVLTLAAALALTGLTACGDDGGDPPIIDPPTTSDSAATSSTESAAPTSNTTTTTTPPMVTVPGPVTDEDLRYTEALVESFEEVLRQLLVNPPKARELIPPITEGQNTADLMAWSFRSEADSERVVEVQREDFQIRPVAHQVGDGLVVFMTCVRDALQRWQGDQLLPRAPAEFAATVDMKRFSDGWRVVSYQPREASDTAKYCG